MEADFANRLSRARRRITINRLLDGLVTALLVAGMIVTLAVILQRSLAVPTVALPLAGGLAGLVGVWLLVTWLTHRPTVRQAAIAIDERAALKERFSTTLSLMNSEDPFAAAAREETYVRAQAVEVPRHFPIRLGRRWPYAAGAWTVAVLLALVMPNLDLLGRRAEAARLAAEDAQARQVAADVKQKIAKVEALVKQINDPALEAELAQLPEIKLEGLTPEDRRELIRKMGEAAGRLQEFSEGELKETDRMLQGMLRQLKLPAQGLSKELGTALARGKFGEAAKAVEDLKRQMENKKDLTDEQKAAIAKDLENLSKQLENLSQQQKDLERALQDAGLDKALSKLSPSDLKAALQKSGASPDTIEKLLQKQQAGAQACKNAAALAKALAKCNGGGQPGKQGEGLSPEGLSALGDQLDQLEAMRQQLAMAQAALGEMGACLNGLGEGLGGLGAFQEGQSDSLGQGTGGPGHGSGPVDTSAAEPTNNTATRVAGKTKEAPIIATWYTQEEQVKGESAAKLQGTVQAARDRAADAISDNTIPSRYHGPLQDYFNDLNTPRTPSAKTDKP
jgi:hypothetical protein